jgi:hypothetical protein
MNKNGNNFLTCATVGLQTVMTEYPQANEICGNGYPCNKIKESQRNSSGTVTCCSPNRMIETIRRCCVLGIHMQQLQSPLRRFPANQFNS